MSAYTVREVSGKRDLRRFIRFPDQLYKGCSQYVPALHKGQEFDLMRSPSLEYCTRKMWIALDDKGRTVGRICCIINPRYNEKYGTARARFGWFDLIDDVEVGRILFEAAEGWARENGMVEIHGPLQYNTLGRQGMLIEGFDKLAPFSCLYNYPYYADIVAALGFEKECDWLQYRMPADQGVDDRMKAIAQRLMERYKLREADFDILKKDREQIMKFFKIYNDSFDGTVQNFIPFTQAEIDYEIDQIMGQLDSRLCCVLLDEDDEVAGFGISTPCLSKAMQKAKGSLFPFGWIHALRARNNFETIDLMINGAAPKWQKTGISSVYHTLLAEKYKACGAKWGVANPQIETNLAVNVWDRYEHELWMRRRCWIKKIEK